MPTIPRILSWALVACAGGQPSTSAESLVDAPPATSGGGASVIVGQNRRDAGGSADSAPVNAGCPAPTRGPTPHPGSINTETWRADESPHLLPSDATVYGALTLEPCSEVLLGPGRTLTVRREGSVLAEGTPDAPIHIGAIQPGQPFATIRSFGGPLRLSHVTIDGGGDYGNTSQPYLSGTFNLQGMDQTQPTQGTLFVDHVTLSGSASSGIVLRDGAGFAAGSDALTVTGSTFFPVSSWARALGTVPPGDYTGNGTDEILVSSGTGAAQVSESITMYQRGVPYRTGHEDSLGELRVDAPIGSSSPVTLTIEPGVVLRFRRGGVMNVTFFTGDTPALGSLIAVGTPDEPIVFTSAEATPAAGDWLGVWFGLTPSALNRIAFARFEYAGGDSVSQGAACNAPPLGLHNDAAVRIYGPPAGGQFITNSVFANSAMHGIDRSWRSDEMPSFLPTNTFTNIARCTETYPRDADGFCPDDPPCPTP
ncbi:MAG TPA: hypothetical protein VNN80_11725 [Polyangiaceae bacterium]|nr:hypothetical protein [Polyangiaceae bacterium]